MAQQQSFQNLSERVSLLDSSNLPSRQAQGPTKPSGLSTPLKPNTGGKNLFASHSHHHHHIVHTTKIITTPTSSYKQSVKLPILEQIGSGGGSHTWSTGRSHCAIDKENKPFAMLNQSIYSGRSSLLNNGLKPTISSATANTTTTNNMSSYSNTTTTESLEECSFSSSTIYDTTDENPGCGSHALTDAAAMINAKLEQLQDKENIPPPGSPELVRYRPAHQFAFKSVTANASGIDPELVQGLNRAFPVNKYKRQPLSVISVAHDEVSTPKRRRTLAFNNYQTPNYHTSKFSMDSDMDMDMDDEEHIRGNDEDGEEEEEEENNNGRYIYMTSQLAPEPGEEGEEDFDNLPDLDQIEGTVEQQTSPQFSTTGEATVSQSPRVVFNPLNSSFTTEDDFIPVSPSCLGIQATRSPRVLSRSDVAMSSPSAGSRVRSVSQPPPLGPLAHNPQQFPPPSPLQQHQPQPQQLLRPRPQRPCFLHPQRPQSRSRVSSFGISAPPSRNSGSASSLPAPRAVTSAPAPGSGVQKQDGSSLSIHVTRLAATGPYGLRHKNQQKKKMVFMR